MKGSLFASILLLLKIGLIAQTDSSQYMVISLKQAIEEHKVKTLITGAYNPQRYYRLSDGNGLHYGRCMDVVLESQLDSFIVLKLDAGYSLIPKDSGFQTMFVTKTIEFPLFPRRTVPFSMYAMCGQIHNAAPYSGVMYSLGEMADTSLLPTIKLIEHEYLQNMIGQHMLWAVANQVGKEELIKYGADSVSLRLTTNLLETNHIERKLVKNAKNEREKVVIKPAYITVKRITLYAGVSYMIIITAGLIFLGVKRYVRKSINQES